MHKVFQKRSQLLANNHVLHVLITIYIYYNIPAFQHLHSAVITSFYSKVHLDLRFQVIAPFHERNAQYTKGQT